MEHDAKPESGTEIRARRPRSSSVILEELGKIPRRSHYSGAAHQVSRQFIAVLIGALLIAGVAAALITISLHGH